jgi:hypothetical protein
MKRLVFALAAFLAFPVMGQQRPPVPDPRLEVVLSTTVISQIERSVAFDKTLPPPAVRPRPQVNEPDLARLKDDVYVERSLMPQRGAPADGEAVIIRRRDR